MTADASVTLYQCGSCRHVFADEKSIFAHQDLWNRLLVVDPEIDAHDGACWSVFTLREGEERGHRVNGYYLSVVGSASCDGEDVPVVRITGDNYHNCEICVTTAELADIVTGSMPADEQKARAFAAAFITGAADYHDEVRLSEHLYKRRSHWEHRRAPIRFAEEAAYIQATLTMIQIEKACGA